MRVIDQILEEIKDVISKVDEEEIKKIMDVLQKEKKIFVDGEGRSGFQAKGFAMRLMHIGYNSYVMGETITPALKKGDIYVAISGSGKTKNTLSNAKAAKNLGLTIVGLQVKRTLHWQKYQILYLRFQEKQRMIMTWRQFNC